MILDRILAETRRTVAAAQVVAPMAKVVERAKAAPAPRDFEAALRARRPACIAEIKRKSPSAGWIRKEANAIEIARQYEAAGAAAISVLTDQPFFGGTLEDLSRVAAAVSVPVLRKDFIVDPYQIVEARAAGADAILLIVSALFDSELRDLLAEAERWGLGVLVETHHAGEVERAVSVGARVIGVNNRDLRTFAVDTNIALRLRAQVPTDRVMVAESGMHSAQDVQKTVDGGVSAILVGESLMRAEDPGAALRALIGE